MRRVTIALLLVLSVAWAYKPVVRLAFSSPVVLMPQFCMHGFSYNSKCGTFHDYDHIAEWYSDNITFFFFSFAWPLILHTQDPCCAPRPDGDSA